MAPRNSTALVDRTELRRAADLLTEFASGSDDVSLRIEAEGRTAAIDVPPATLATLAWMLRRFAAEGEANAIDPDMAITTQRAADLLNVSRPHLVRLLEEGEIPFHRVGTHRRVFMREVIRYREARHRESLAAMQALADQANALDLP
jgi:excisionase family DNA binding protein